MIREYQSDSEAVGTQIDQDGGDLRTSQRQAPVSRGFAVSLPNLDILLGTPAFLPDKGIMPVVDNKMVGDTGFEPLTSTVCKKHKKKWKEKI